MEYLATLGIDVESVVAVLLAWSGKLFAALLIVGIGHWISNLLTGGLRRAMDRAEIDPTLTRFLASLSYVVLIVIVVLTALGAIGIPTTNFLAVLGAAGLGVGLALKDSLSNFAAGIMLVIFRPFRAGDYIEAAGIGGTAQTVGIFNTVIKTPDNRVITVPNGMIYGNVITNYSAEDERRIDLTIGISYDDDISRAKKLISEVLERDERVLKEPEAVLLLMELGDSSVNIAVRPWVKRADYWVARSDLLQKIKQALEGNGMSIPYPQRDLHIVSQGAGNT
jgi:small conductance mechanosensitive channel